MTEVIEIRKAHMSDCKQLWYWRNSEQVRAVSFNKKHIAYATHKKWFCAKIRDKNCLLFIIVNEKNKRIGQVRYDVEKNKPSAAVSISVAANAQRRGVGARAIHMTRGHVTRRRVTTIRAYIKKTNTASIRMFKKVGFKKKSNTEINHVKAVMLEWKGK